MLKVYVNWKDPKGLDKALRKFKKICMEVELEARKHEYYLRPGLRKMQKSKLAQQRKYQEEKEREKKWQRKARKY